MRPFFDLAFARRPAEELYDLGADPARLAAALTAGGAKPARDP